MIDAHAHIYDAVFDIDRSEILRRAFDAGVKKILTIGTSVAESRDAVLLAKTDERIFATVAIHPNEFNEQGAKSKEQVRQLVKMSKEQKAGSTEMEISELREIIAGNRERVAAVGECGLDFFGGGKGVSDKDKKMQTEGFLAHIELAREFDLPIVIHCRDAYGEMLEILRAKSHQLKANILHCYGGDREMTEKFLEIPNLLFSFAGNSTYPTKKSLMGTKDDICESLKIIPLSRILTETDCPYLAPQKYRGTRNEPAYVVEIVRKISEIKEVSFEEVGRVTEENAYLCFPRLRENIETI